MSVRVAPVSMTQQLLDLFGQQPEKIHGMSAKQIHQNLSELGVDKRRLNPSYATVEIAKRRFENNWDEYKKLGKELNGVLNGQPEQEPVTEILEATPVARPVKEILKDLNRVVAEIGGPKETVEVIGLMYKS